VGIACNQRSLGLDLILQRGELLRASVPAAPSFCGDIIFFLVISAHLTLVRTLRYEVSSTLFLGTSPFKMVLGHQRLLM
jgi:hypothetical protein